MMNTYKPTPEKVAGWIKDHKYIQLAKTNTVEVWRAQKPGSSSYAFDLTMSRYGMAMYGDTGCLVWNVGKGYGLEFLASDDEDYVYNKLDHSSRETDLDEAYLVEIVYEAIIELLGERGLVLPEWKQAPVPMAERISELDDWLVRAAVKGVEGGEMAAGELSAIVVALRDCQRLEVKSTEAAYQWLGDHQELLELAADLDYTLSKPTNSVLQRIYLVRHAAQQILAQQKAAEEAAQQVQYCYSMGPADEQWSDDGLALYIIDRELAMGTVIQRGVVDRSRAHSFLPDANAVLEYMAERAGDENSEFCDGFPNITKEQEAELARLLEPLKAWADRTCEVTFYTVPNDSIESYIVTAEDVAAAHAYRESLEASL